MKTGMKKIMYIEENEAHRELMPDVLEAAMPKLIVLPHTYNSAKSAKLKYHLIIANITRNNGEKQLNELAKVLERQTTAPLIITVENKERFGKSLKSLKEIKKRFGAAAIVEKNPENFAPNLVRLVRWKMQPNVADGKTKPASRLQ